MGRAQMMQRVISERLATALPVWRETLRCLAVFSPSPNSFSEAAATAVADIDTRTIQALAAAGFLIRQSDARYALPLVIAQLFSEAAPFEPACRRMIEIYSGYVRAHAGEFSVLTAEYPNLMRALSIAQFLDPPQFANMTLNLGSFFELRGDYILWKDLLLQSDRPEGTVHVRARLLLNLAWVCEKLGETESALKFAHEGLDLAKDDTGLSIEILAILGHVEMDMGMLSAAHQHLMSGLGLAKKSGSPRGLLSILVSLSVVATRLGDLESANLYIEDGVRLARERNDPAALASLMTNLGVLLYHQGRFADAVRADEDGLKIARQIGYSEKQAALLQAMGGALIRVGELERAESCLTEAIAIATSIEHRWYIATIRNSLGHLLVEQNRLEEAVAMFKKTAVESPPDSPDVRGYAIFGLAGALARAGKQSEARQAANDSIEIFSAIQHHAAAEVRRWMQSIEGVTAQ